MFRDLPYSLIAASLISASIVIARLLTVWYSRNELRVTKHAHVTERPFRVFYSL
jgi:hypothetical protein